MASPVLDELSATLAALQQLISKLANLSPASSQVKYAKCICQFVINQARLSKQPAGAAQASGGRARMSYVW